MPSVAYQPASAPSEAINPADSRMLDSAPHLSPSQAQPFAAVVERLDQGHRRHLVTIGLVAVGLLLQWGFLLQLAVLK